MGAVEITDRRVRRRLPRDRDSHRLTDADIRQIADRLNDTLRQYLGWRTPGGVFAEMMVEATGW